MSNQSDDIKNMWQAAKKTVTPQHIEIDQLISKAEKKKKSTINFHIVNMLILGATLAGITSFFYYVTSFNELISKIGSGLMMGGLVVRIAIELFSIFKSGKIDLTEAAIKTTNTSLDFYNFRKRIHGPVTFTIVAFYTIGFFMLTPEFSLFFSTPMMILIDGSYIIGAVILTWQISKGVRKEMENLSELVKLKSEITNEA